MQQIVEEIKALFFKNNIPVFGIAKAASLEKEPLGKCMKVFGEGCYHKVTLRSNWLQK